MKKTATKIVIDSYRKANNKPLTDEEILKGYTGTRKDHDMACLCKTVICRGKALECMAKARAEGKKEGIAERRGSKEWCDEQVFVLEQIKDAKEKAVADFKARLTDIVNTNNKKVKDIIKNHNETGALSFCESCYSKMVFDLEKAIAEAEKGGKR